jgi:D-3-phosphoglycerate dehydrogenase
MHTDQVFRVGVPHDVRRADGTFVFDPFDLSALDVPGVEWTFLADPEGVLSPDLLEGLDGLYHFSLPLTAASLEGLERLTIVARHGVGLDIVDVNACTERAIAVSITPRGVTRPMASAAVTLVLALAHRLRERDRALHDGDWRLGRFSPSGTGLTGRTLGVIGFGRIGQEVVRLLTPWDMRTLVATRSDVVGERVTRVALDELVEQSDFVVIACPLTPETRGLIDRRRLSLMKSSAFLVNVARGAIVDQVALVEALRAGRIAGAGLDVFDPEPIPDDDPLLSLPNVIGAPHSLGYTDELLRGCVEEACRALLDVASGHAPAELANPEVVNDPCFAEKLARYRSRSSALEEEAR